MFPIISYLDWIEGRPAQAVHDLGSSDLRTSDPSLTRVTPSVLSGLEDPPDDVSLEAQVAAVYDVEPENVLLTAGATHANFLAVAATSVEGGDAQNTAEQRILVEKPGYEPLVATPKALDIQTDRFLRTDEHEWQLESDRISGALTDETDLVVITNRHNPTGVRTDRDAVSDLADQCAEVDARLLVDEVYGPFDAASQGSEAFGSPTAASLDNTIVTGSLTKFFGLGELRIGWLIADEAFLKRAVHIYQYVPSIAGPSVALARRALHNADHLVEHAQAHIATNHDRLKAFVADRPKLSGTIHPGCTFGLVFHDDFDGDALSRAAWDAGILVVPGRFFGVPEGFRIAASRAPEDVEAALAAFGSFLDSL